MPQGLEGLEEGLEKGWRICQKGWKTQKMAKIIKKNAKN